MRLPRPRRLRFVAIVLAGSLACSACGGSGAAAPPTPTIPGRPAQPAAPGLPAGTSTRPAHQPTTFVAYGRGRSVPVYRSPQKTDRPEFVMPNPWLLNGAPTQPIPQAYLVLASQGGWTKVQLPERPNGLVGWLPPGSVTLLADPWSVSVSLEAHRITVRRGDEVVYAGPVATGAPATPTPTGLYYIRVLLRSTDPASGYGPYAYGLSAHSDALTTFDGGDAEIGLHGNNDAAVLGRSVTHGCVRMDNAEISRLAAVLPLGTPISIRP